jgi:acyl-CoA dehydrogenase
MIDFSLTEEQEALREMLLKFTQNEIIPVAARYDREGEFAMELVKKAYDLQIMNASVPEAYGGGGMGCIEDCIIHEELSYGCSGISTCLERI